jgi:hypothetical protein
MYTLTQNKLKNVEALQAAVDETILTAVQTKIRNYFRQLLEQNPKFQFDAHISVGDGITLFLHWLVRYWSENDYGKFLTKLIFRSFRFEKLVNKFFHFFFDRILL